jgi:hypothetical protein
MAEYRHALRESKLGENVVGSRCQSHYSLGLRPDDFEVEVEVSVAALI